MYYQTGSMRQFNNDLSPLKNSNVWQRENEFQYAQRSKYERSQVSYGQQQKSRIIYEEQKTDRYQKSSQNKQFMKVPIKIKSPDREDYNGNFRIQILNVSEKNSSYMAIHITDDSDSLFLWSFLIRENQFMTLKNQQQLKVDFHGFPDAIIQFLGLCVKSQQDSLPGGKPSLIYYTVFEIAKGNEQAELRIMEINKYKQSCHFNLKFKKANDEQLKIFLAQKYDKERKENARKDNQLSETKHISNLRLQQMQKLRLSKEQTQKELNQRINQLERNQRQQIKETKLRIQQQNMRKQKEQNEKNKKRVDQLNQKIEQLKGKYQEIYKNFQKANERIINLQSSQNSLKSKNSILEQQCDTYQKQNKELKAKQLKLNQDYHALRNENTKLSCTIQSLEDRLKQKTQRLVENHQIKSTNVNQISTLQQNLRQEKKKVQKLEEKNQNLQAQIAKLQKKYQDLQTKYQKRKDKASDYKQILQIQQKKIQNGQKQQKRMLEEIVQLKRDREKAELDLKDRQIKIKDLKSHIQQNQQHMENQKKIISELNKKLNQKSIGVKPFALPSTLPTYNGIGGAGLGLGTTSSIVGRQFSSTISSTSQSRLKYSPSPISTTSPLNQKITDRIVPPFRKYREGVQNDRDQENSHHSQSHSRSPIVNRLNQQLDPEDADKTKQRIGPIKFKK